MATSTHEVETPQAGRATFTVHNNDSIVGASFVERKWWEGWMHEPLQGAIDFHCRPGDLILDIGANIGSHTVALAKMAPNNTIEAFEPQRHVCDILETNVRQNQLANVNIHRLALGEKLKKANMVKYDIDVRDNQGGKWIGDDTDGEEVRVAPLASVINKKRRVCLVKMDVEGYEPQVLEGAKDLFDHDPPVIFFEDNTGKNVPLLKDMGYTVGSLNGAPNDFIAIPAHPGVAKILQHTTF